MNKLTGFLAVSLLSFTATAFGQQGEGQAQNVKTLALSQPKAATSTNGATTNGSTYTDAGYMSNFYVYVGPSNYQEYTFTVYGLHFAYPNSAPATIHCQPRQYDNYDYGFPDAFSCQVISTEYSYADYSNHIKVRIRRLDQPYGWGQNLRLDFVVFETAHY
jgi:hypothetical protein